MFFMLSICTLFSVNIVKSPTHIKIHDSNNPRQQPKRARAFRLNQIHPPAATLGPAQTSASHGTGEEANSSERGSRQKSRGVVAKVPP